MWHSCKTSGGVHMMACYITSYQSEDLQIMYTQWNIQHGQATRPGQLILSNPGLCTDTQHDADTNKDTVRTWKGTQKGLEKGLISGYEHGPYKDLIRSGKGHRRVE